MYLEESSKPCPICSTLCLQDQIFPNFMLNALVQKSIAESTSKSNTVLLTPTQRQQYIEANKNIKELGVYAYFLKETKNQKDQDLITLNSEISSLTKDISTIQERISTLSLRNQEIKQKFTTNTTSSSEKHVVPVVNTKDDEVEITSTESTPVRAGKKRNLDDHLVMHKSGFLEEMNADIFTPSNMLISKLKDHQKDLQDAYFGNEVKTLVSNTEDGNKSIASKPDIDERPVGQFQQTLTKICKYNRFKTLASIHFADPFAHNPSSIVSAIEFDKDDQFFATAGVTRKIKIFDYKDVVWDYGGNSRGGSITNNNMVIDDEVENSSSEDDSIDESEYSNEESSSDNAISTFRSTHPANRNTTVRQSAARRSRVDRYGIRGMGSGADGVPRYPVQEISCKSKISCLSWNSYIKTQLVSSDYEGIIQLWDSSNGRNVYNFTEHEKRAWSVDFSVVDPLLFASGGDDTKVKIWSTNMKNSATTINSKANICSVKFNPGVGHQVAFGSADHHIHYYDLRHPLHPIAIFKGHKKAASYVKFINPAQMLSASTDCSLRLWNINVSTNVNGTIKSKSGNTSRFIHTTSFASTTSLNSTKGLIGSSIPILEDESLVRSYTGHLNEKNFVGLTVNSDGEYIACGSETNTLHVYHKQLSTPLIIHPFGNSVDAKTGNEIGSEDPTSFVSSVCWKRMEENILVAANSQGRIKVLQMV